LQSVGVPPDHVFDCGLCTVCGSGHFFSFRQDPNDPGRMLAAIARLA
jgi:polyphenol oxidase